MPIIHSFNKESSTVVGIWLIEESLEEMLAICHPEDAKFVLSNTNNHNKRLERLAARILAKQLTESIGLQYKGIHKNVYKQPELIDNDSSISISHSYPYAAAIISNSSKSCGVDIELCRPKLQRVSHKFQNEEEARFSGKNIDKLCIAWTAKEAVYKLLAQHKLSFKNEMEIQQYELNPNGQLSMLIRSKAFNDIIKIHYILEGDFAMSYCAYPTNI
ncbi:4'-phosphopantetheinyl transferase superfamily protein [Aureibacter tunicatorum]|uniref:Phosphopantetheinyl transferase n=1 Tax=Aureibacter tunicatorum TaxID=866807 RepID=A0AAE3XR25_9BACT|nr:4'-phosphopantetheinyl transferase superfamily protein [Aureibacter tunicatorum]MDR6241042.1 phosphopantetheinyl transferase [Aureibacter tunicatorum]BDD03820.1 hypothetical protein AUTU_13030 [Aureibacter tunicatorum]